MEEARLAVLKERAKALAKGGNKVKAEEGEEFLVFSAAGERFGVKAGFVREVVRVEELTPLPGVPFHVLGIVNVRGEIVPVADLHRLLGIGGGRSESVDRVLILESENLVLGLAVDGVDGMHRVDAQRLQPAPSSVAASTPAAVLGLAAERVLILDARELLNGSSSADSGSMQAGRNT